MKSQKQLKPIDKLIENLMVAAVALFLIIIFMKVLFF